MTTMLNDIRVALRARTLDLKKLRTSREASVALTLTEQASLALGKVAELMMMPPGLTPSAKATPPANNVEQLRAALQTEIDALGCFRSERWARDYGSLEEDLCERALVDLILAHAWLGESAKWIAQAPQAKRSKSKKDEPPGEGSAPAALAPAAN